METILLAIKPQYIEQIKSGIKQYEYRTIAPKLPVNRIIIYATNPVKKIVGEVEVKKLLKEEPHDLWKHTKRYSASTKLEFFEYYANRKFGYAYKLGKLTIYDQPKELSEFGFKFAPQSFAYLKTTSNKPVESNQLTWEFD